MTDPRALALGLVDPASFMPSPRRPRRRIAEDRSLRRTLIRVLRRESARATQEPAPGWVPKLQRYPY